MIFETDIINLIPQNDRSSFLKALDNFESRTNCPREFILPIMHFETGGSMKPNQYGGSGNNFVGLIQFGKVAASYLGTTQSQLAAMTASAQMEYVTKYFESWYRLTGGNYKSIADAYLIVLFPAQATAANDKQLQHIIPQQAAALYDNGVLSKNTINKMFGNRYYIPSTNLITVTAKRLNSFVPAIIAIAAIIILIFLFKIKL